MTNYQAFSINMRHRKAGKKLNRDIKHKKALFKNLINSLVIHEEIKTTESKAKAVKNIVDKLINKGKSSSLHSRRTIAAFLQEKHAVNKIVDDLAPRFKNRISGFTRIIRIGKRRGDDAMMVKLELVDKAPEPNKQTKSAKESQEKKADSQDKKKEQSKKKENKK